MTTDTLAHIIVFVPTALVGGIIWFALGWVMCMKAHGIESDED